MSLEALIRLHEGLDRLGPGDEACTRRALARCLPLPPGPRVVDLGCGTGASALLLARELGTEITAIDLHPGFLATLQSRAEAQGLAGRIETRCADFTTLELEPASVDLLWSEGAMYLLGFEAGLERIRTWMKPSGCLAFTDATWLVADPPAEVRDVWKTWYPTMGTVDANLDLARRMGFEILDAFALPEAAWWAYYRPLWARCEAARVDAAAELQDVILETEREMKLLERWPDVYGYVFYILRKRG